VTSRESLADDLARARTRTLRLVDFDDAELSRQYDPLMSPLVWDLAHIGQQEELWLLRGGDPGRPGILPPAVEGLYDAFIHSRASRFDLPLLSAERARAYCATVRSAALDALDALPDDPTGDEATFVYAMVVSHENQHDETMLQALNLRSGPPLLRDTSILPTGRPGLAGTSVLVPAGPFVLGVDTVSEPYSLDNERPAHVVDLPAFRIGRVPVTNGEWQHFIDDGGYNQSRWWSERGWQHRQRADLTAPQFWSSDGATRTRLATSKTFPPTSRYSMSPTSRPRLTRPGPAPGCPPRRNGRRPARGIRRPTPGVATPGERSGHRMLLPTWVARRWVRHPSGRTRPALRHTGLSRCWAMSGSGRPHRCGPGPGLSR